LSNTNPTKNRWLTQALGKGSEFLLSNQKPVIFKKATYTQNMVSSSLLTGNMLVIIANYFFMSIKVQ
jgi:hypothetical protein